MEAVVDDVRVDKLGDVAGDVERDQGPGDLGVRRHLAAESAACPADVLVTGSDAVQALMAD